MTKLLSDRLLLRRWREGDREPFAQINGDPEVGRWLAGTLDRAASDALLDRIEASWERDGFGLFAVEVVGGPSLIGFVGLSSPSFDAHFTPAVEIGWRLSPAAWGRGYATEGALKVLEFGFDAVGLDEVVSFTTVTNTASTKVMERIGLHRDPADDFDHPALDGHPLQPHVLYRLAASEWREGRR
ncbi:MAG: GNAT family N-acetyltransferase [Actinomycetota bacterium]